MSNPPVPTSLDELIGHLQTSLVYCLLTMVVAGLTVYVIRAMHGRLEGRHAAMQRWEAGQEGEGAGGASGLGTDFSDSPDFGPAWRIR